jgi:nitroreductase
MFKDLVARTRSCRRFDESQPLPLPVLRELIDLARLTPSAGNMQPLRFVLSSNRETNARIFSHLRWAAYLRNWNGPAEGERPAAYIVITHDLELTHSIDCDHGIAAQTILLGATEMGLAGCIIGSISKEEIAEVLQIPSQYEIMLVIALGKPREHVQVEPVGSNGNIRYWRDEEGTHHVPKRGLDDLILRQFG